MRQTFTKRLIIASSFLLLLLFLPVDKGFAKEQRHYIALVPQGEVFIQKANSPKRIVLTEGMKIEQGDRVITNAYSSVTLIAPDTNDQLIMLDHSMLFFNQLYKDEKHYTDVHVVSGNVQTYVTPINETGDYFYITVNNLPYQVKGTQFFVTVDPKNGKTSLGVFTGVVATALPGTGSSSNGSGLIYPAQPITINAGEILNANPGNVDLESMLSNTSPQVLQGILNNFEKIRKENELFLNNLLNNGNETPNVNSDQLMNNMNKLIESLINANLSSNPLNTQLNPITNLLGNNQLNNPNNLEALRQKQEAARLAALQQQRKLEIENNRLLQEQENQKKKQQELLAKLQEQKKQAAVNQLPQDSFNEQLEAERLLALEIERLKTEKASLSQEIAQLTKRKTDFFAQFESVENLKSMLAEVKIQLTESNEQLALAKAEAEEKNANYKEQQINLRNTIREQSDAIKQLQQDIDTYQTRIKELLAQLNGSDVDTPIGSLDKAFRINQYRLASIVPGLYAMTLTPAQERNQLQLEVNSLKGEKSRLLIEVQSFEKLLSEYNLANEQIEKNAAEVEALYNSVSENEALLAQLQNSEEENFETMGMLESEINELLAEIERLEELIREREEQ